MTAAVHGPNNLVPAKGRQNRSGHPRRPLNKGGNFFQFYYRRWNSRFLRRFGLFVVNPRWNDLVWCAAMTYYDRLNFIQDEKL